MNPDVFVTIAFVLWAVLTAVAGVLVVAHERHRTMVDDAAEQRYGPT